MSARVFISHRPGEAAALATALAADLDAMFGEDQVVRIAAHPACEERWREAVAGTLVGTPILIALVTPEAPPGAGTEDNAALRACLDAGLSAGALILPLLGDGVADRAPGADLPAPFERLSHLPHRRLRNAEWPGDIARIAVRLRGLGVLPHATTHSGTMPLPLHDDGPSTTPMPIDEGGPGKEAAADGGRRGVLGMVTVGLLLVGGWGAWRWHQRRAANLTGIWRGRIGLRGAPTSGEGGLMLVTLAQKDRNVRLSSTVGIETDPQWEGVREAWKERNGSDLKEVIYRGEGEFIDEGEAAPKPASASTDAASAGGSAAVSKADPERARRIDPTLGMRRVVIKVRIAAPGTSGEKIDEGLFRGVVDLGDQRIHGRLWLESEQAERVVDLRRGD
jgi:hypothetical protein